MVGLQQHFLYKTSTKVYHHQISHTPQILTALIYINIISSSTVNAEVRTQASQIK